MCVCVCVHATFHWSDRCGGGLVVLWCRPAVCVSPHDTHTHTRLTALFPGLPGWAGTRKVKPIWILLKQETVSGNRISWAICKSAPWSRQITTPAPHHSVFYRPDALPAAQPTASKHWRHVSAWHLYHYIIPVQLIAASAAAWAAWKMLGGASLGGMCRGWSRPKYLRAGPSTSSPLPSLSIPSSFPPTSSP